jgi:hypothetical protein
VRPLFALLALLALMFAPLAPAAAGGIDPVATCALHHAPRPASHDGTSAIHSCCVVTQALPDCPIVAAPLAPIHLRPVSAVITLLIPLHHPGIDVPPPRRG